ncbi:hypothetical protein ES705_48334 [subsurface metagenome]
MKWKVVVLKVYIVFCILIWLFLFILEFLRTTITDLSSLTYLTSADWGKCISLWAQLLGVNGFLIVSGFLGLMYNDSLKNRWRCVMLIITLLFSVFSAGILGSFLTQYLVQNPIDLINWLPEDPDLFWQRWRVAVPAGIGTIICVIFSFIIIIYLLYLIDETRDHGPQRYATRRHRNIRL